jgi:type IV pilus assembly protein PilE
MIAMSNVLIARNPAPAGRGFTLIELVVTIAIIGILVTIAYPAYQEQIRKSRRPEGQGALVELANVQQQFFSDNFTFTGTLSSLGYTSATALGGHYTLSVPVASAAGFTVKAVPIGAQAADKKCVEMTLTNTGVKASKDSGGAATTTDCWRN